MTKKLSIGQVLIEKQLITQQQLDEAVTRQAATGDRLGKILVELGFIKEGNLLHLLSEQLKIPYIDLKNYSIRPEAVHLLPEFFARRYRAMALNVDDKGILVGMVDPLDLIATDEIKKILNAPFNIAIVKEDDLLHTIDAMYRRTTEISSLAEELSAEMKINDYDVAQLGIGISSSDAPVVKLLQTIFEDAVQVNASDIHIEPDETVLRIRQRIDGVLHEQVLKERHVAQALALRLKLMGGLNIAEKRLPQDGRFSLKIKDKNFDVRLSTLPVQFGESIVMRLLNQSAEVLSLDKIGMPPDMLERFRKIISYPNGLLLVTGPTGSGKTTTLYGALSELNTTEKKIVSVEDPVEYRLPRISQVQVQQKIDLTFSRILRSVLRQDPDIIMIGELRDSESVAIALRAAMTGHFVLTTVHTNDVISSAVRLIDMGAEGYLVATVLRAAIAQRLVRRICENCVTEYTPSVHELAWLKSLNQPAFSNISFKHGVGCSYCHNTGFKGQIGVFELLEMNLELADALRVNDVNEFSRLAAQQPNYRPLAINAMDFVLSGLTTVSEVIRITGESLVEALVGV
jgi:MSHA biogenesis protein MshE